MIPEAKEAPVVRHGCPCGGPFRKNGETGLGALVKGALLWIQAFWDPSLFLETG